MVECDLQGNRYFHGNDIPKNWNYGKALNFVRARSFREQLMPISEITMYGKGNMQEWKNSVCLISNKSQKHFKPCFRKYKGLKEEHYFNEIAPQDTKMRMEVIFWSQESFVSLCFLDPRELLTWQKDCL